MLIEKSKVFNRSGLWYNEDVAGMETEELQRFLLSLVELRRKVLVRADELMMINKTPMFFTPNVSGDVGGGGYSNVVHDMMFPVNVTTPVGFGCYHNRELMHC